MLDYVAMANLIYCCLVGNTCLVNQNHCLVAGSPKVFCLFYRVGHLWHSGAWCLINSNVTPLHSISDFILVMLGHICVLLFVPGLFPCKLDTVLDHVLSLTEITGKLPRTVLVVLLSLAFLEWTPWMSIGVPEIITEPCLVGFTIIWLIKHVVPGGLTIAHLVYL